jgi:hypothetical protein
VPHNLVMYNKIFTDTRKVGAAAHHGRFVNSIVISGLKFTFNSQAVCSIIQMFYASIC